MDSTNVGFIPQIADKLRDFFLRHHLMQTAQPLKHGHMQRRIGHHQHPFVFRVDYIFDGFRRVFHLD
jgi:hypothetical protein